MWALERAAAAPRALGVGMWAPKWSYRCDSLPHVGVIYTTSSNATKEITCPDHLSMLCSLHSATIPYSFYNVRNGINNEVVLQYTDPTGFRGGRYKIVFPSGSYTALSFINTFQAIMTGSSNFLGNPWESASGVPQYRIYYWQYNAQWVPLVVGGVGYNPFTDTTSGKQGTVINASLDRTRLRYHIYEINSLAEPQTTFIDLLWDDTETTLRICSDLGLMRPRASHTRQIRRYFYHLIKWLIWPTRFMDFI